MSLYTLTNTAIFDAEKNDYDPYKTRDDQSCWAATAANMLAYTGWGAYGLGVKQNDNIEDTLFAYFYNNFRYGNLWGGNAYYGIEWFFDGTYAAKGQDNWDQPKEGTGNRIGISASEFINSYSYLDNSLAMMQGLATALQSGGAVGLSVKGGGIGHAITCWGYTVDSRYTSTNPNYYTGLFISDSDDNKTLSNPQDTIRYVPLAYKNSRYIYTAFGNNVYISQVQTLAKMKEPEKYSNVISSGKSRTIKSTSSGLVVYGTLYVSSGGKSYDTTINNGGMEYIYKNGIDSGARISSGGRQYISKGGVASGTVLTEKLANQIVCSGGVASGTKIYNGASQVIYSGGKASGAIVSGGFATQLVVAGGSAVATVVANTGEQWVHGVARKTLVSSGGSQVVSSGGSALFTKVLSGGSVSIRSGGYGSGGTVYSGAVYMVSSGGIASAITVSSGGEQYIWKGGVARGTILAKPLAKQFVYSGGVASGTKIYSCAYQVIYSGGKASGAIVSGGFATQLVVAGGSAVETVVANTGEQWVHGVARKTLVSSGGSQVVSSGGKSYSAHIMSGGSQIISSGGMASAANVSYSGRQYISKGGVARVTELTWAGASQVIYSGGVASGTRIYAYADQYISSGGKAISAIVSGSYAWQTVSAGGSAFKTVVCSYGKQRVDGFAISSVISNGGTLNVFYGGIASATIVSNGGTLNAFWGALVSSVNLKNGAVMSMFNGNTLYGKNTFTGATIMGGSTSNRISLAKNATLNVGAKTAMKELHLNASNANLNFTGTGNTLGSLQTNKSTKVSYDVSKLAAKGTAYMLTLSTKNTQKLGVFSVNVKKGQGAGVYELSKNITQAKNTAYTVNLAGAKQGVAKLNGLGLIKGNAIYAVNTGSANSINLTVAATTAKPNKGTAKADKLKGTVKWDVFYGGKGNDTITGGGGRDVAVYDTTAWGKDVIAKTGGTMTLLFNGLKSADIKKSLSGNTMTITRKSNTNQKITVQGWSNATHNIVFASGMTAFNKYLKAASPTAAQATAARNEAFKKAGLASA